MIIFVEWRDKTLIDVVGFFFTTYKHHNTTHVAVLYVTHDR